MDKTNSFFLFFALCSSNASKIYIDSFIKIFNKREDAEISMVSTPVHNATAEKREIVRGHERQYE